MADDGDYASDYAQTLADAGVENRVRYEGESAEACVECGNEIPKGRRDALPGIDLCVACADVRERRR